MSPHCVLSDMLVEKGCGGRSISGDLEVDKNTVFFTSLDKNYFDIGLWFFRLLGSKFWLCVVVVFQLRFDYCRLEVRGKNASCQRLVDNLHQ